MQNFTALTWVKTKGGNPVAQRLGVVGGAMLKFEDEAISGPGRQPDERSDRRKFLARIHLPRVQAQHEEGEEQCNTCIDYNKGIAYEPP